MPYLQDYTVGKGRLAFKQDVDANGTKGKGFEDMGNCPELTLSLDTEKLEHFSSRSGLKTKDMDILIQATFMLGFTLDEPNIENLQRWFLTDTPAAGTQAEELSLTAVIGDGDSAGELTCGGPGTWNPLYLYTAGSKTNSTPVADDDNIGTGVLTVSGTQTADATHTYEVRVTTEGASGALQVKCRMDNGAWSATPITVTNTTNFDVKVGAGDTDTGLNAQIDACANCQEGDQWEFTTTVAAASTNRVTNLSTSTKPVVKDATEAITYTEGGEGVGHYQVDYKNGIVYINYRQPLVNPIALGDVLHITAAWGADTNKTIFALSKTSIKGHVLFVGDPPQGRRLEIGAYVSVKPTGDMPLISEEWLGMQFEAEVMTHSDYSPGNIRIIDHGRADI